MSNNVNDPIIVIFDSITDEDASVCRATLGFLKVDEVGNVNVDSDEAFEPSVHTATGSSKRTQVDRVDKSLGEQLAVGRALKKLSDDILADAQKQIDKHDRERSERKARKDAKARKVERELQTAREEEILASLGPVMASGMKHKDHYVTKTYVNGDLVSIQRDLR